jgi:DNA-binding GntR family transcriptional regulator
MKVIAGAVPKYRQLLQLLRKQILSGDLAPGARLATEEELVQAYGLSRGTVRRAIEQLAAEGLVRTEQGSGTYVSAAHPSAVPFRFGEAAGATTRPGAATSYRIVTKEIIPASIEIAERLSLPFGEPVIHLLRVRSENGAVAGFSERFLPHSLCPDLLEQDLTQGSIHDVLVNHSELPLLRAVVEVEALMLGSEDAALLGVAPATPAIVVSRMTYTAPARPAVWYRAVYRDAFCLYILIDPLATDAA